jgi:hypothetical protein
MKEVRFPAFPRFLMTTIMNAGTPQKHTRVKPTPYYNA